MLNSIYKINKEKTDKKVAPLENKKPKSNIPEIVLEDKIDDDKFFDDFFDD